MEYGLILVLGITIGVAMMIPIAASMIKQTEKVYEYRVRKLEEKIYGRKRKNNTSQK